MLQLLLTVVNLIKMNNRNKQCVINVDKSVVYLEEQIIKLKRDLEIIKAKLDKECNTFTNGIQPVINFKWGEPNTRNGVVKRLHKDTDIGGLGDLNVVVQNMVIEFSNFEKFKNYKPTLLIDRFKPRGIKVNSEKRLSGYKHEKKEDLISNNRNNEFLLSSVEQIIDIKPETYFGIKSNYRGELNERYTKGTPKISSLIYRGRNNLVPYIYLRFRLRYTIDNNEYETGSLGILKLKLSSNNYISFNHA